MILRVFFVLIWLLSAGQVLNAQDVSSFPKSTIRIIVSVAPGGGIDFASRVIADKMQQRFGQPVVVENRPGASGNLAAQYVSRAAPDGYVLLTTFGEALSIGDLLAKDLGYDPMRLEPVSLLTSVPLALVVRPNFPANNFKEFLDYLKANPDKINYASNGVGTVAHLTAELFRRETGTKIAHVPYKGTSPALNDLVANHVDMAFIQYSAFVDFYETGKVKLLAIASTERVRSLPAIPTMRELGYPNIVAATWNMLVAPPRTPPEIIEKLNQAVNQALGTPDARERFEKLNTTVEGGSVGHAREYVEQDRAKWKKLIEAGL